MMRAENYIIKGQFFRGLVKDKELQENISDLQMLVQRYFLNKGFKDTSPASFGVRYYEQEFCYRTDFRVSKLKSLFGKDRITQLGEHHFAMLRKSRPEFPCEIKVHMNYGKFRGKNGFFIEIIIKPIKYFQIVQLNESPNMSPEQYSFIVNEGIEFASSFGKANACLTVQAPLPISLMAKSETSDNLRKYEFSKIADFLENTNVKLELGKDIEAVDELIRVIENFIVELTSKLGETPRGLHEPEKNIQILGSNKHISSEMQGILHGVIYNNIYLPLKTHGHTGKKFDLFDLRYLVTLTEESINYLLDKVWKNKIQG